MDYPVTNAPASLEVDLQAMERARFATKPLNTGHLTDEDMAIDAEIERLSRESPVVAIGDEHLAPKPLTNTQAEVQFLGDALPSYKPAETINDLENQVFQAKQTGCDAIEASDGIINHFTRSARPEKQGYFLYRDIKVFIIGRARGHKITDHTSVYEAVYAPTKEKKDK